MADICDSGGIYVDLDYDSYKSLAPYLTEHAAGQHVAVLARAPLPIDEGNVEHTLQNDLLASSPGHPFWEAVMAEVHDIWYHSTEEVLEGVSIRRKVEYVTGPAFQYRAWQKYMAGPLAGTHRLVEIPAKYAHPFAWYRTQEDGQGIELFPCMDEARKEFSLEDARKRFNTGIAYACTYHACSWGSTYLEAKEGEPIVNLRPGWCFPE